LQNFKLFCTRGYDDCKILKEGYQEIKNKRLEAREAEKRQIEALAASLNERRR